MSDTQIPPTGSTPEDAQSAPSSWKAPEASGLPPAWQDADTAPGGSQPSSNQAGALGGLIPEDRPEVLLGVALAGGALAAIVLRTLVQR